VNDKDRPMPPLVAFAGALGGLAVVRWAYKTAVRINRELEEARMARVAEQAQTGEIPTLRRDPVTGAYRRVRTSRLTPIWACHTPARLIPHPASIRFRALQSFLTDSADGRTSAICSERSFQGFILACNGFGGAGLRDPAALRHKNVWH
jgi:hypothetical protein